MADYRNVNQQSVRTGVGSGAEIDQGLRSYMLSVYNYMGLGVALTGIVAMLTAQYAIANPAVAQALFGPGILKWVVMLAPLGFVLAISGGINRFSTGTLQLLFWTFAAVMGVSLSSIFLVFTGTSIAQTFFVTAAAFGALSLYGYTTKKDLSAWGKFLFMGVIGLIIASVVNIFLGSSALQFAISSLGVLIFAGLTAYDTQRIRQEYDYVAGDAALMTRSAIGGALSLYLNFINMFMFLLQFMGGRE